MNELNKVCKCMSYPITKPAKNTTEHIEEAVNIIEMFPVRVFYNWHVNFWKYVPATINLTLTCPLAFSLDPSRQMAGRCRFIGFVT